MTLKYSTAESAREPKRDTRRVVVLIGLLVVHTRALAGARFENSRLFRALPLCSALAVTGLGLWLCYSSLHAG